MTIKILLTSFQTWLPHQESNSSDDLLSHIEELEFPGISLTFLRQLPVDVDGAKGFAIAKIEELQPHAIICCGMAESRTILTVESCANSYYRSSTLDSTTLAEIESKSERILLKTSVDLEELVAGLAVTEISHDSGKFVCEGLYYQILNYLQSPGSSASLSHHINISCIFVHVPILTPDNLADIVTDFSQIIEKIAALKLLGAEKSGFSKKPDFWV
ncbi:pyroglutamyl-peptidase I family protein [Limnofasciculus baicalensis]|uniref:Peptidase C15 n=1 Tax=Limnofasciculus baicalensis BBK-W-15 TaxID=2699891 RepID=A0AAE3GTJ9_9CYAN|nr:peptidase C15 [Limnofasciculus baicalensis]MCP2730495.1 peptidase C15 [Limnofasciculus baicalensis BBK-W-15]